MSALRRPTGSLKDHVIDVLRAEMRPMTGLEIFDRLNRLGASRFLSQTYRAVSALRASGTIRRIEMANKYTLGAENVAMNLVCQLCGTVDSIPAAESIVPLTRHAEMVAFTPGRYIVEVVGRCARCDSASWTR